MQNPDHRGQDLNPPEADFAGAQPAAYGFEEQDALNSKTSKFQPVDSIQLFQLTFGFVWKCLEIFDLNGHNLGTVPFLITNLMQKPAGSVFMNAADKSVFYAQS